ncbi:hypothetical protein, partial [Streptococcus pneumoniae]|uniref:hypothetical protein n=1 Tax=Streptococcus pneumoniae TaxID=1313 RepID=UPI001E501722
VETLRTAVEENINDETLDGIDAWRDRVRDESQDNPNEAYQWFRVDRWLCDELKKAGEIVIDNGSGHWWGRGCCGQALVMDGTIQK